MKIHAAQRLHAGAKELKAATVLIEKKLTYFTKAVHELESVKNNPSARDVYPNHVGKRDALEAVKNALTGNLRDLDQL